MKILIINTFDRGGAAHSCKRLHLAFLEKGIHSKTLIRASLSAWPKTFTFTQPPENITLVAKVAKKIKKILKELKLYSLGFKKKDQEQEFLKKRHDGLELFSFPNSDFDITQSPLYNEADIINLHWVSGFLDYHSFFKKNTKPVVWTLHDMNPFTGGEHYIEHIFGIDHNGFPNERIEEEWERRVSELNLRIKEKALSCVDNLVVVAPSKWLANAAKSSAVLKNKNIVHIPYGLDKSIFRPRDREFSRDILQISNNKIVFLFVADSLNNNRKGLLFLIKAFKELKRNDIILCAVGKQNKSLNSCGNIMQLGPLSDERLMSLAYSAADVFVIPSLMDNFPNTVLESLMCGTPVIGFPTGGIPEMIQHGRNGLLTQGIGVSFLLETLTAFLDAPEAFDREAIREEAVKRYDQKIQADRYIRLFKNLLAES